MADQDDKKTRDYGAEYARQLENDRDPNSGHTTRCMHGNVVCTWCERVRKEQ